MLLTGLEPCLIRVFVLWRRGGVRGEIIPFLGVGQVAISFYSNDDVDYDNMMFSRLISGSPLLEFAV